MNNSILEDVRKNTGVGEDEKHFDTDLITYINTALMILTQIGVGKDGFMITGTGDTWFDFIGDHHDLIAVQTYVYLRVKLIFDPPTNSTTSLSMEGTINMLEWRLRVQADKINLTEGGYKE